MSKRRENGNRMNTEQKHIHSGFGETTTASEVIAGRDLTGKIVVITSGQSGIGLETTRVLTSAGALMVIGARDVKKATAAVAQINLGHFRLTAGIWSDT